MELHRPELSLSSSMFTAYQSSAHAQLNGNTIFVIGQLLVGLTCNLSSGTHRTEHH